MRYLSVLFVVVVVSAACGVRQGAPAFSPCEIGAAWVAVQQTGFPEPIPDNFLLLQGDCDFGDEPDGYYTLRDGHHEICVSVDSLQLLVHEMTHFLLRSRTGNHDPGHTEDVWQGVAHETEVARYLAEEWCG